MPPKLSGATALYILGLCTVYVPADPVLSASLCRMAWEAQQRVVVPSDPLGDIPGFYDDVAAVVWPKPEKDM